MNRIIYTTFALGFTCYIYNADNSTSAKDLNAKPKNSTEKSRFTALAVNLLKTSIIETEDECASSSIRAYNEMRLNEMRLWELQASKIIIFTPGQGGFNSWDSMKDYSSYVLSKFPTICRAKPNQFNICQDTVLTNDNIIIAGSPRLSIINIKNDESRRQCDIEEFRKDYQNENSSLAFEKNSYNDIIFPNTLVSDLGQKNCQLCFVETVIKQMEKRPEKKFNAILYANSEGTATTINYIASLVKKNQYDAEHGIFTIGKKKVKIKAIILEAPLAKGADAIESITDYILGPIAPIVTGLYNFFTARSLCKTIECTARKLNSLGVPILDYNSQKEEPINSIKAIPNNIPFFIIHSEKDNVLPFKGAKALYYARRTIGGAQNTYFIKFSGERHVSLLSNLYLDEMVSFGKSKKELNNALNMHADLEYQYKNDHSFNTILDSIVSGKNDNSFFQDHFIPQEIDFGKKEYDDLMKKYPRPPDSKIIAH